MDGDVCDVAFFFFSLPPVSSCSERGARHGGSDGQREAEESAQAPDHLLQLPAGSAAEEVPVGAVPGPAGASRAGGAAGPHTDTGQKENDRRRNIWKKSVLSLSHTENARGDFTYEIKRLKFWLKALAGFAVNLLKVQDPKMYNIFIL